MLLDERYPQHCLVQTMPCIKGGGEGRHERFCNILTSIFNLILYDKLSSHLILPDLLNWFHPWNFYFLSAQSAGISLIGQGRDNMITG